MKITRMKMKKTESKTKREQKTGKKMNKNKTENVDKINWKLLYIFISQLKVTSPDNFFSNRISSANSCNI